MERNDWLATQFEGHRSHLRAVAYRMLGSPSDADDAVQESWIRLTRSGSEVENLGGWLTTVVARVCMDKLRQRQSRREAPLDTHDGARQLGDDGGHDPEHDALLADAVGPAMLVVLDTLAPAERVAFVLHDMFAVPFQDIAPIVGRSPAAARQLASRARRRVQGISPPDPGRARQRAGRAVVDAFLAASRDGDFGALLAVLDPDIELRSDPAAVAMGAPQVLRGAAAVAETFAGRARAAQPALIDGHPGLAWAQRGRPQVVFRLAIAGGRITDVELIADSEQLDTLDVELLGR